MPIRDPNYVNGVRPIMFALSALMFHLVPPGDFLFLDDDDNLVTALIHCPFSNRYICIIYQEYGHYTHYRHIPSQDALQYG